MVLQLPDAPGRVLLQGAVAGTALFTVSAVAAVAVEGLRIPAVVIALALFAVGVVTFLISYWNAVQRSRYDAIGVGGLYFLAGSAPTPVRRVFLGAVAAQVIVGFATAGARPFTSLAFGILVPMYGLGVTGLWGATHGTFPKQPDRSKSKKKSKPAEEH